MSILSVDLLNPPNKEVIEILKERRLTDENFEKLSKKQKIRLLMNDYCSDQSLWKRKLSKPFLRDTCSLLGRHTKEEIDMRLYNGMNVRTFCTEVIKDYFERHRNDIPLDYEGDDKDFYNMFYEDDKNDSLKEDRDEKEELDKRKDWEKFLYYDQLVYLLSELLSNDGSMIIYFHN